MTKLRIAVLMGGPSSEYSVSIKTGRNIAANLNKKKYVVKTFLISKKGKWPVSLEDLKENYDLVLIAMHGEYGENGELQKILEKAEIKFAGSGSWASRIGMDKILSARAFRKVGLNVPENTKKVPLVVKPVDRGSSVGVSIVKDKKELAQAINLARKYSSRIMMQEFIEGREFTCGVLEINGRPRALPPTEIIPKSIFFDFKAKYSVGGSREITPPKLPIKQIKFLQNIALIAHKAIGARGISRTDVIMDKGKKFYVLEINTLPGMTKTSLLPQQALAAGITFSKLLDIIVEAGMRANRV